MIPFKTLRTLDNFAVIQPPPPPCKRKIYFLSRWSVFFFFFFFLSVCINVRWKIRTLLLSKARNKMCPNFILIKDQFRGLDLFSSNFQLFACIFQLSLSPFSFVCYRGLSGKVPERLFSTHGSTTPALYPI